MAGVGDVDRTISDAERHDHVPSGIAARDIGIEEAVAKVTFSLQPVEHGGRRGLAPQRFAGDRIEAGMEQAENLFDIVHRHRSPARLSLVGTSSRERAMCNIVIIDVTDDEAGSAMIHTLRTIHASLIRHS